ncbi:MAG TPA: conjugal transfer protein TraF, partial [Gammaproteobacteria bacterium]
MMNKSLIAAGLFAAGMSSAYAAPYGFFDARSVAMGNVSVATGNVTTAAFSNPAMLAINENKDSFAFL